MTLDYDFKMITDGGKKDSPNTFGVLGLVNLDIAYRKALFDYNFRLIFRRDSINNRLKVYVQQRSELGLIQRNWSITGRFDFDRIFSKKSIDHPEYYEIKSKIDGDLSLVILLTNDDEGIHAYMSIVHNNGVYYKTTEHQLLIDAVSLGILKHRIKQETRK